MNRILIGAVVAVSVLIGGLLLASAAEKAYLGTVIHIDMNTKVLKVITNDGAMIEVVAEGKAAKHLDKIPLNSMIDITVDVQAGAKPTVKSWKMTQAQSPCRIFDGSMCAP
jgi:hypothetical protein